MIEAGLIERMADGTVKQTNPFTGAQVWTVTGRGNRPLVADRPAALPIEESKRGAFCAFCEKRYWESPPEKNRLIRDELGWHTLRALPARELSATVAEFRRVPNLFEILSYDYWNLNYGFTIDEAIRERERAYLADPIGLEHILAVTRQRLRAGGVSDEVWERMSLPDKLSHTDGFFGGSHDVIIARRHYVDGATDTSQFAGSGTLTPAEHAKYLEITIDGIDRLYWFNRHARYVAAFQNWLRPAGASFDHLHKQIVAIDEYGPRVAAEIERASANGNLYNEVGPDYAARHGLILAQNESAVAFAGFGHRYPSVEVYSTSPHTRLWELDQHEVRDVSDLLLAMHAATGTEVAINEEWHHQPIGVDVPMPWRVVVKWRISTMAGFEGGTQVHVNTIDPWGVRDRVLAALESLRAADALPPMAIGDECRVPPGLLRYAG